MTRAPLQLPARSSFDAFLTTAQDFYDEPFSAKQCHQLWRFLELLVDEDSRQNLARAKDGDALVTNHLLDSLSLLPFLPFKAPNLMDAGSGAGFPGIPLAVMRPKIPVTLVEPMGKRADFLRRVLDELKLKNAQVVRSRLEDLHPTPRLLHHSPFTLVTARALAPLAQLIPLCAPLLAPGGYLLAMKGPKAALELKEAEAALYASGLHLLSVEPLEVPGLRAVRACIILTRPALNVR